MTIIQKNIYKQDTDVRVCPPHVCLYIAVSADLLANVFLAVSMSHAKSTGFGVRQTRVRPNSDFSTALLCVIWQVVELSELHCPHLKMEIIGAGWLGLL